MSEQLKINSCRNKNYISKPIPGFFATRTNSIGYGFRIFKIRNIRVDPVKKRLRVQIDQVSATNGLVVRVNSDFRYVSRPGVNVLQIRKWMKTIGHVSKRKFGFGKLSAPRGALKCKVDFFEHDCEFPFLFNVTPDLELCKAKIASGKNNLKFRTRAIMSHCPAKKNFQIPSKI